MKELRYHGIDHGRRNSDDQERGKHAILHILNRVTELPEGETVEDAHNGRDEELAVEVRWISPVLLEGSGGKLGGLEPSRSGKLLL